MFLMSQGPLLAGAAPSLGRFGHRAVSRHQDARDNGRSTGIGPHPYFNSMGRSHPPAAMVGRLAKGIGDYITRFRSGTHQLFVNAKKIGPLRWVRAYHGSKWTCMVQAQFWVSAVLVWISSDIRTLYTSHAGTAW